MTDPEMHADAVGDLFGLDSPEPIPLADAIAALRGPQLINRSYPAARYLLNDVNTVIKTVAPKEGLSTKQSQRYREMFRSKVGRERAVLKVALDGYKAQRGILDSAPNPRARAMRVLKQRHLREYQELTRGFEQSIRDERAEKRRQQKIQAKSRKASVHG